MSFFEDAEIDDIAISKMIVHVVAGGKEEFVPQPELPVDEDPHIQFFLARILDAAVSPVHRFNDKSAVKTLLGRMARDEITFEAGGQELARLFKKDHVGSSSGGAFFVFELTNANAGLRFYSLIKYDYREAVELYAKDGKNAFRQIVQAFVKEKRAIQKSCLVRVRNGVVESDASAFDRMGESPDLTDYFQKFLEVSRDRDTNELSSRLIEALRKTLKDCREHLPNKSVVTAFGVAKDSLAGRDIVDEDAIREAIFVAAGRPTEEAKVEIEKMLTRGLKNARLTGVTFKPDPKVLQRSPRLKLRTAEDVLVEYPGDQQDRTVKKSEDGKGGWIITITTAKDLVENDIADKRPRENTR